MSLFPERIVDDKGSAKIEGGISERDYLAVICANGILANPETGPNVPFYVAEQAYRVADALMAYRKNN